MFTARASRRFQFQKRSQLLIRVHNEPLTTEYFAGIQFGTLRARIRSPVTGGTVTVVAVRPEEQRGWGRRQL